MLCLGMLPGIIACPLKLIGPTVLTCLSSPIASSDISLTLLHIRALLFLKVIKHICALRFFVVSCAWDTLYPASPPAVFSLHPWSVFDFCPEFISSRTYLITLFKTSTFLLTYVSLPSFLLLSDLLTLLYYFFFIFFTTGYTIICLLGNSFMVCFSSLGNKVLRAEFFIYFFPYCIPRFENSAWHIVGT